MFDKEFQFAIDQAQANIREDGELLPTFIGFGNEPELDKSCAIIVATPFVGTTFDEVEKSKQSAIDAVNNITRDDRKLTAKVLEWHGYAIGIELIEWGQK